MPIKVDFSKVESFQPVPAGAYLVTITGVEEKTGKESGLPYINWELTVADGEFSGRKLWLMTSLAPKALFGLQNLLKALEVDVSTEEMDIEPSDYVGHSIVIEATQETYTPPGEEPRVQNKIKKVHPAGHP